MVLDDLEMTIARWHFPSYCTETFHEKYRKVFHWTSKVLILPPFACRNMYGCNNIIKYYQWKGMRTANLYLYLYIKIVDRVVFNLIPVSSYTDSVGNVTRWSLLNHWFNKNTHVLFVQFPWSRLFPMNWHGSYNAILANQCRLIK